MATDSPPLPPRPEPAAQPQPHEQPQPQPHGERHSHRISHTNRSSAPPVQIAQGYNRSRRSHQTPYAQYPSSYGRPVQSYHQQQYQNGRASMAPQAMAPQQMAHYMTTAPAVESKQWAYFKGVVHAFIFVSCICALGLTFSMIDHGDVGWISVYSIPIPVVALIWSSAELLIRGTKHFAKGIHPGAHVGVCLILWLGFSIIGGISTSLLAIEGFYDYYPSGCDSVDEFGYSNNLYYEDCRGYFGGRRAEFLAYNVFTWFLWLFEFVLFIGACVDTAKRNSAARQPIMVVNNPTPYYPEAMQGMHGMPGWQQMPPNAYARHSQYGHRSNRRSHRSSRHPDADPVPREPSPMTPPQEQAEIANEKGKGPEHGVPQQGVPQQQSQNGYGVTEFYAPAGSHR